jgi:hypothetical protein
MTNSSRDNRKVKRISLSEPLKVILCSIGGNVKYELSTRNLSNSGFFLEFESPARFPFNQSSIMEVWLQLGCGSVIFFNGKMARVVFAGDPAEQELGTGIAVKIVQIDRQNEKVLRDFISSQGGEEEMRPSVVAS